MGPSIEWPVTYIKCAEIHWENLFYSNPNQTSSGQLQPIISMLIQKLERLLLVLILRMRHTRDCCRDVEEGVDQLHRTANSAS